jgi:hypothetical protein
MRPEKNGGNGDLSAGRLRLLGRVIATIRQENATIRWEIATLRQRPPAAVRKRINLLSTKLHFMEKFLMLVREDLKEREKKGPEHFDHCIRMCSDWIESLVQSGNLLACDPLTSKGSYVTLEQVLSDGPFIEAKEAISGYFLIHAENLEQANSIAQRCPLLLNGVSAAIEVRPINLS